MDKFKARNATLGFNDEANLDDGAMWATASGYGGVDEAHEARMAELVKRAVS